MADEPAQHVRLFGLEVADDALYLRYREKMTPILHRYGGRFGYDFAVSFVFQSETPAPINRLFTIVFPDPNTADRFFSDAAYRAIRAEFFEPAVTSVTTIAAFSMPASD